MESRKMTALLGKSRKMSSEHKLFERFIGNP